MIFDETDEASRLWERNTSLDRNREKDFPPTVWFRAPLRTVGNSKPDKEGLGGVDEDSHRGVKQPSNT